MKKQQKLELLNKLKQTTHTRPDRRPRWFTSGFGLCTNFDQMCYNGGIKVPNNNPFKQLFIQHIKTWPHYTGSKDYFIPAVPSKAWPRATAELMYDWQANQYDRRSPYCKLRYELLDHIIRCVEAE